jgi:hypothetical protein
MPKMPKMANVPKVPNMPNVLKMPNGIGAKYAAIALDQGT